MFHIPVMTKEMIDHLACKSTGIYVDATLGGGSWAESILEATSPDGFLIGFDQDVDAISETEKKLSKFAERYKLIKSKFSEIPEKLNQMDIDSVDGAVADLGVSSHQLDVAERGFSFSKPAKLDMRMDKDKEVSAYDIINNMNEKELADIFFKYGEERFSRRIARRIVNLRRENPIETTQDLAEIVKKAVPPKKRYGRIHPATRVFQALRIFSNSELDELDLFLEKIPGLLKKDGRLVIVSYHSLEDRRVKKRFKNLEKEGGFARVTKKVIKPSENEIDLNPRSRSAKLRALERN